MNEEQSHPVVRREPPTDLRGAVRFPLHLHVDMHEQPVAATAETSDISSGGVLIHCDSDYPVGTRIQFSISMPAQTMGSDKDVLIDCEGRVVRCTPAGGKVAVAAIIDEYKITR